MPHGVIALNRVLENTELHKSGARIHPTALRHREPGDQFRVKSLGCGIARLAGSGFCPQSPERIAVRAPELRARRLPPQSIRAQLTVNVLAALVPPPGAGVVTVTLNVPALAMSAVLIVAVISVELTYVVARGDPAQFTTELLMNPVPLTVRVNPAPPWVAFGGERDVRVGLGFTALSCTV
jgi:hypothetical protein